MSINRQWTGVETLLDLRTWVLETVALQTKEDGGAEAQEASNALLRLLWSGIQEADRTCDDGYPTCHVPTCGFPAQAAAMRLGALDAPDEGVLNLQIRCSCGYHMIQYDWMCMEDSNGCVSIMAKI